MLNILLNRILNCFMRWGGVEGRFWCMSSSYTKIGLLSAVPNASNNSPVQTRWIKSWPNRVQTRAACGIKKNKFFKNDTSWFSQSDVS